MHALEKEEVQIAASTHRWAKLFTGTNHQAIKSLTTVP
jgi:hypothetical protein